MNRVNVFHVGRCKTLTTTIFGVLAAIGAAQGVASAQTGETAIRTLGGPNRFSGPMHLVRFSDRG